MTATEAVEERVVLVDEQDRETGSYGKLAAHEEGLLHRAVSVMLFDARGRLLLQRRAVTKYHSPGLWSNSCCGHPREGESVLDCARRRLDVELGITNAPLAVVGQFLYRAELSNGLIEHELDHVVMGRWTVDPAPNPAEVHSWRWAYPDEVRAEIAYAPRLYTAWAARVLDVVSP